MMSQMKTALFVLLLLLLAGCVGKGTQPSRFYHLTPMAGSEAAVLSETSGRDITLGIGPIMIPSYLDRQQIVTSRSQNKIEMSEFDRWAGTLSDNFARVLSENLSTMLSTDRVYVFPWRASAPLDYHIGVEVIRFDGRRGGDVSLIARWGIYDAKKKEVLLIKKSSITEPADAKGYEAFVAAQSLAMVGLSRDIAAAIMSLSQKLTDQ